jgi:hypothetical protein
MKALLIVLGAVLLIGGGFVLVQGMSVTTNREVLDIGPLEASVEEKRAVPTWLGGLAAVAGAAMIIAGVRAKGA